MQQTVLIIIIEVLAVLLIALLILEFRHWRAKNRRLADLEMMIEDVKEQQILREEKLVQCLIERFKFDEESAHEYSNIMLDAEKNFLIKFIEQQFQDSVAGFYENLCMMLDTYLEINKPEAEFAKKEQAEVEEESEEDMLEIDLKPGEDTPPEWGDVFD